MCLTVFCYSNMSWILYFYPSQGELWWETILSLDITIDLKVARVVAILRGAHAVIWYLK